MDSILKHIAFVNEQQVVQEKLARKYEDQPWRADLHTKTAQRFKELSDDLKAFDLPPAKPATQGLPDNIPSNSIFVTAKDVEDLPQELLRELSISDTDRLEFTIASVIDEAGGVLSLDKILIGIYRRTKEIVKRNTLTSRLYRMAQREQIFPVSGRKGVYSTRPYTEEAARRLIGQEESDDSSDSTSDPRFSI